MSAPIDNQTTKSVKGSRILFVGLIASLALNLLFIGGLGAAAWHHKHRLPRSEIGLLGFVKDLPDDRQGPLRAQITSAREAMRPLRRSVREAWAEANKILSVDPFDKAKFQAALAKLGEAEAVYKNALNTALADTAAALTADERKQLQTWRDRRRPKLFLRYPGQTGSKPGDTSED